MTRASLFSAVLVFVLAVSASADTLLLTDGTRLQGEVKRTADGWVVTSENGKKIFVAADRVKSIEKAAASLDPAQKLATLRRSVEGMSDIKLVLERYKNFIAQNPGSTVLPEAEADVSIWKKRQADGLAKVGDKWVTKQEQADLQARSLVTALAIRQVIKEGHLKESLPMLDKALADDPQNASAHYLKGVVLARLEQFPAARKEFEAAVAARPEHGPSHNNLAVVLWRQNNQMAALNEYDKAITSTSPSRQMLDNTAEALEALAPDHRKSTVTKKIVIHFKDKDSVMQKQMAEHGLYRWGGTWVDERQLAKLQAAEKSVKDKLDSMSAEYDSITAKIQRTDRDIKEEQILTADMVANSVQYDQYTGRQMRYPLPQRYYDMMKDIETLKGNRVQLLKDQERLRSQVKGVRDKLPVPRYTGVQKLIDIEGTPDARPAPAEAADDVLPPSPSAASDLLDLPAPRGHSTAKADPTTRGSLDRRPTDRDPTDLDSDNELRLPPITMPRPGELPPTTRPSGDGAQTRPASRSTTGPATREAPKPHVPENVRERFEP